MANPARRRQQQASRKPAKPKKRPLGRRIIRAALRIYAKSLLFAFLIVVIWVGFFRFVNPPITLLMYSESQRLNRLSYVWMDIEDMSPNIPLAIVASEDANFCLHNGFDYDAIETAINERSGRGASTISQQVAKNLFLWPGRSWLRKGLEAGLTVMIEALWPKRRILEVYLNIAEFDSGVFGVAAASRRYFGLSASNLRLGDAAKLALVLPAPRTRNANSLSATQRRRASSIAVGASTLRKDGRADCFLDASAP